MNKLVPISVIKIVMNYFNVIFSFGDKLDLSGLGLRPMVHVNVVINLQFLKELGNLLNR
jgi:hypothetical protein